MKKFGVVIAVAVLVASTSAQAQILGFGREEPATSIVEQIRAGEFNERCSNPVGEVTEEAAEAYDLVDMLVGAPEGVRYNVTYLNSDRTNAKLGEILTALQAVQPAAGGTTVTAYIENSAEIDARQSSAGQIMITSGLVNALIARSDATSVQFTSDLAFILAHEYAHVLMCHYNRSVAVSRNRRALRTASAIGLLAVAVTNSDVTRNAQGVTVNTNAEAAGEDYISVMAGLTLLRTFNSSIVNPAWSRQQERDADRLAVELMAMAGFRTEYVESLLTALHAADEETTGTFTTLAAQLPSQAVGALALSFTQQDQRRSFRDMVTTTFVSTGLQMFQQWRTNQLRHFHDPVDRRMNRIRPMLDLRNNQFADQDRDAIQSRDEFAGDWGNEFSTSYTTESRASTQASEASRLYAAGDFDGGCAAAAQALTAGPDDVQALFVSAQCELHRENLTAAGRHFTRLQRSDLAMPDTFTEIATLWAEAGHRDRAEAALTAGEARYPGRFYIARMHLAGRFQDPTRVQAIAAECAASTAPQPIKDDCARTSQSLAPPPAAATPTSASPSILNPLNALIPRQ
jgi:Zn-dependent protease with chaperone function